MFLLYTGLGLLALGRFAPAVVDIAYATRGRLMFARTRAFAQAALLPGSVEDGKIFSPIP
jgi:hypothetical protein